MLPWFLISGFVLFVLLCPARIGVSLQSMPETAAQLNLQIRAWCGVVVFSLLERSGKFSPHWRLFGWRLPDAKKRDLEDLPFPRETYEAEMEDTGFWFKLRNLWRLKVVLFREFRRVVRVFFGWRLEGAVEYGFANPATTGECLGLYYALPNVRRIDLSLRPCFTERRLQGWASGRAFVLPGMLLLVWLMATRNVLKKQKELES